MNGKAVVTKIHKPKLRVTWIISYYSAFQTFRQSGFHDLFNHYPCFFPKHNEYCKTEALDIWVNFSRFLSNALLVIFINIKCKYDFTMAKTP